MAYKTAQKTIQRARRHNRIRSRVSGTAERPRLCVFRSNTALYAQLIDDVAGKTLFALDTRKEKGGNARARAHALGVALAKGAQEKHISKVVFDRGGFLYAGSIKTFADSAREGGLVF